MADRAKNTAKKKKTYATAVVGIEEKNDFFTLAKCTLRRPPGLPNGRIPNTKEVNSFFVDLKSTDATNEEVLNAINTAGIVGANVRDDLWVIEFVCESEAAVKKAMTTPFAVEGKQSFEAILPRHKTNKYVLIKMANVPFGQKDELRKAISKYWSTYGTVVDVKPYQFPGRPWLTKRWDLLLKLNDGVKKLNASPVFKIEGYTDTLISTWNGAKKACLRCLVAGHSTSLCPVQNPNSQKVGESANPLQKIDGSAQAQKRKEKGSKVSSGSSEGTKASSSSAAPAVSPATLATPTTSAITDMEVDATAATASTTPTPIIPEQEITITHSGVPLRDLDFMTDIPDTREFITNVARFNAVGLTREEYISAKPHDLCQALADLYDNIGAAHYDSIPAEQSRSSTPPAFQQTESVDPDTPRKGKKRGAKEDGWTPTLRQLRDKLIQLKLCVGCWGKGHVITNCNYGKRGTLNEKNMGKVLRHPKFKPILAAWSHQRRQEGVPWALDDIEVDVVIPPYCIKCHKPGHIAFECTATIVCNHCQGSHLGIDCPSAPTYAFEK